MNGIAKLLSIVVPEISRMPEVSTAFYATALSSSQDLLVLPMIELRQQEEYKEVFGFVLAHIFGWNYEHSGEPHMKHHMVFDLPSLVALLERNAPLENVREFDYRKEEPFRLGIEDASTNLWSLNIAATNPS